MTKMTTDTLLLSAACPLKRQHQKQTILDAGCGSGVLGTLMRQRGTGFTYTGVEIDTELFDCTTVDEGISFIGADFLNWRQMDLYMAFDHVISNPPYFLRPNGRTSPNAQRETARGISLEDAELWVETCWKYLKPLGWFSLVWPSNLLSNLMTFVDGRASHMIFLPIQTAAEKSPIRFIVLMRKPAKKIQQAEVDYLHPLQFWGEERVVIENILFNGKASLWQYLKSKDLKLPQI
ncbi:MAG: methyltransferase, partial [Alphaproteobacteria bacterium]